MTEKMKDCLFCKTIKLKDKTENPYFVIELETGIAEVGWYQYFKGYTIFYCKKHVIELHELEPEFRKQYLYEISLVGNAIWNAFKPKKLNYAMLGNKDPHLHCHIFPRYENDPNPKHPVWTIDKSIHEAEDTKPNNEELKMLKEKLLTNITELL